MEATLAETGSIVREVHFTLTPEEFTPYRHSAYRKAQQKASIKGFRQGKAPLSVIEKLYGKELDENAAEEAIQKAFADYATEHDLQPFGTPFVLEMKRTEEGGLDFIVRYEVLPEVTLGEYKGLKTKKIFHVVTPEEIDREVEWLRERHRTEETVDTIADEHHTAVVDFQKLDESGAPLIGDVSRDVPVNLRSERMNPELKELLIGKRLDDKLRINLPVGGENGEKDIPYEVTIKDVKHVKLPELDAEFASKLTGEEESDVEDLRDMIKQSIDAEYDGQYARFFRDSLIDQLISAHEFDVPSALINQIVDSYLEDEKKNHPEGKLPADFPYREFFEDRRESAERVARWLMLRDQIINAEGIEVTEEDLEGIARMDAERLGMDPATLVDYYKGNDEVHQRILAEKVLQLLVDYAEIEEEIEDVEWEKQREVIAQGEGTEGAESVEASESETADETEDAETMGASDEGEEETTDDESEDVAEETEEKE